MFRRGKYNLQTRRLVLRLPRPGDYVAWSTLRRSGDAFLSKWEPIRSASYDSKRAFADRCHWARHAARSGRGLPYLLTERHGGQIIGALTLDNIRHGPSMTGTVGYWIGPEYARQGYMFEALEAVVNHAFSRLDLSRIEAGCLPENAPSRALLEKAGFKYEGVAQSYLQINGRWRDHVLYANIRPDRRGESDAV